MEQNTELTNSEDDFTVINDKPGELVWVHKNQIHIDPDYQRKPAMNRINSMAKNWNWIACGAIVVARREGKFWAVDGQHRLLAAQKNSSVEEIPCIVFRTRTQAREAKGFYDLNGGKPVSAYDKYRSLLVSGDTNSLFVKETFEEFGISVMETGPALRPHATKSIALALRQASRTPDTFRTVWKLAHEISGEEMGIHERMVLALEYLDKFCGDGLDNARLVQRLRNAGPQKLMLGASAAAAYYAEGGARVYANGFLDVINKGLQRKFVIDKDAPVVEEASA